MNRRAFIRSAGGGALTAALPGSSPAAELRQGKLIESGRKLNIACVGCGGKGVSDITGVGTENIVALCDVDAAQAGVIFKRYPDVPKYQDYRKMLLEMDEKIDAVTVSTPDHMHYAVGMMAISMGKHVFIQKPLARSLWEVRELTLAARKHNVVSQMGNQGHAGEGVRLAREWVQAGLLGPVREVHMWTSKLEEGPYKSKLRNRVESEEKVPPTLDWNLWVGSSPMRAYSSEYAPRKWRNWWDFGCGALGDIGCHTMDATFFALELGAPAAIRAETSPFNDETYPDWSIITYEFAARGSMAPVKVYWYDGGKLPEFPKELGAEPFERRFGYYMRGEKALIYDPTEKCNNPRLLPAEKFAGVPLPEKTIPRVPHEDPFQEWIRACKGGPRPGSNFDYAGPLAEMVQLGNLAIRARGKRIEWDGPNLQVTNVSELNRYIRSGQRQF